MKAVDNYKVAYQKDIFIVVKDRCGELDLSLEASICAQLLLGGLEASMAELGGRVNELKLDLLEGIARCLG